MNERKGQGSKSQVSWFIEPLNTETQSWMMELGYISDYQVEVPTSRGVAPKLYTSNRDSIRRIKRRKSPVRLKYRAYRRLGADAPIIHKPHFSS